MKNQTTLTYIESDGKYLMLHRVKKERDVNKDKWIGIGGHLEPGESPFDCARREILEETGLTVGELHYRGIVTFVLGEELETEYMHLFTARDFSGELIDCDEGVLEWISREKLLSLPMWEGDKIFLDLLPLDVPFFSLKLVYAADGTLLAHSLDFAGRVRERALVSGCLLGLPCRYDGKSKPLSAEALARLRERYELIPVCPEQLGGLETPRLPCERVGERVLRRDGADCTEPYRKGAEATLELARRLDVSCAILKARSPSCGSGEIYDGSFSGRLTSGDGVTAELLRRNGISVLDEGSLG